MPAVSAAVVRKQIAAGELATLYALVGADDIEKSELAAQMAEAIDEGFRAFNVDHLYGGETTPDAVMDAANTLPMMVPRRLLVVHDGEKLLAPKRDTKAAEAALERLERFLKAPPPHATLVFICGGLDQRRRAVKILLNEAHVVDCGTIADAADADRWLKARAARDGVNLEPAAARLLVQRAGLDVARLRAAFERVALYAMGQPRVTADDVKEVVAAAAEAQENFGIANAIRESDAAGALRQLAAALDGGAAPFFVMGQIRTAAERLPTSRVVAAIEALFRTDLALKSSGGEPRILLERLVVELCGERGRGPL
jgi:DNA polymerase III subunit delta